MIDVQYAKELQNLREKYYETGNFEDVLPEALELNETAFTNTMNDAEEYQEWTYYIEQATKPFRNYDIVEIAKVIRKELKNEFGKDIKFNVKTKRGYTPVLYITIKPQNDKYFQPLNEFMNEYKKEYRSDELFEKYSIGDINRLNENIRNTIKNIVELFVVDNSDIMTDYFDINYVAWYKLEFAGESHAGYTGI